MKLNDIMSVASQAYGGAVVSCWNPDQGKVRRNPFQGHSDTLAYFICREIAETYDPGAISDQQMAEAARVLQRAADELGRIAAALDGCAAERRAA